MQCYFNDILAGILLNAIAQIMLTNKGFKYTPYRGLYLTIVAGIFWEYIAPLFNSRSISDPLDIVAYLTGFLILTIINKIEF